MTTEFPMERDQFFFQVTRNDQIAILAIGGYESPEMTKKSMAF